MILENDWRTKISADFLTAARDIFEEQPRIGLIQLRDPLDPNENHGSGKPFFNPWSCRPDVLERAKVDIWKTKTKTDHNYMVADFPNGFNNNPIIIRKDVYRECGPYPEPEMGTDPRHGESEYQERVANSDWLTAHIGLSLYSHMGRVQTVPR
jgi:GT2 family glycosyltransferase